MEGKMQAGGSDRLIAALAERHHGVVALRQLLEIGLTRKAIESRLKRGRLHAIHRGVYAVGHRILTPDGWRMAAVLAAGPDAVLSHYSAADLWGLRGSARRQHDVTVPRRGVRSRPAIRVHEALLPADEVTDVRGIPVTSVPRTTLDLAAKRPMREVARLIHEAEVQRLWDPLSLWDLLERYPGRSGSRTARAALSERGWAVPKEVFTTAFAEFLDRRDLPRPEFNVWLNVGGHMYEIDCLWRAKRVIVELDGRAAHDTARAFESDRAKDRRLTVAGWRPTRVTWRQLHREAAELARDLVALTT
jgi:predicted transcriptional regulator of viral defense system/very-short-patch-repair endonuclease